MAKVRVVQRFGAVRSANRPHPYVKPKVHFLGQRGRIRSSNLTLNNRNSFKIDKENLHNFLRYYGANKLSVAVHCVALVIMSIMIAMETESYRKHPIGTIVEDNMYPIQKIDFPGVAICNINVISHVAAMNFAETLWTKDSVREIANMTLETVKYLMRYMGTLYQFEHKENRPGDLLLLDEILQKALRKDYDVLGIMKELTPKCATLMTHCYWEGNYRECDELFVPRWTPEGYCCTFNHVRWSDRFNGEQDEGFKINVERSEMSGKEYGLRAILRPELNDYYYRTISGQGFKVLFYPALDYPDAPSGGLREVLLNPGSESFLSIEATSSYSSPEIMKYDKQIRKCLFNTERDEVYGGYYSYSQCMMLCRVDNVRKTCGCIPFFYPHPDDIGGDRICTVRDLMCLQRYKYKWWSVEPIVSKFTDHTHHNISEESPDGRLHCDCWPTCDNVYYTVIESSSHIHHSSMLWTGCTNINITGDNIVLNVSFESTGIVRLRHDVMFYWYELMSNYGGLCSLFLEISIMTPIELLYLLCLRFWQRRKSSTSSRSQRLTAESVKIETQDQPIYWSEIMVSNRSI